MMTFALVSVCVCMRSASSKTLKVSGARRGFSPKASKTKPTSF